MWQRKTNQLFKDTTSSFISDTLSNYETIKILKLKKHSKPIPSGAFVAHCFCIMSF